MKTSGRTKLSVSLPSDLVRGIDAQARARAMPRSAVIEDWLRHGRRAQAEQELAAEVEAYYSAGESLADDQAIAAASSRASKRLETDEPSPATPRARKARR